MRTEILRSPETDRKKVLVPTALTDLTDYAASVCSGNVISSAATHVGSSGALTPVPADTASSLVQCVQSGNGIKVLVGGLFLIVAKTSWSKGGIPAAPTPAPSPALRTSVCYGGSGGQFTNSGVAGGTDICQYVTRLAAGDVVEVAASSTDAASTDGGSVYASIQVVKLAP